MGINSIRDNLTKDGIISTIRMSLSADPLKPIILVEGTDDIAFLQHVCKENVYITESYSGKNGVFDILDVINQFDRMDSVIAICDRDYNIIHHNKVFYYDYCCLEMMMLSNDGVFRKMISSLNLRNISLERQSLLEILLPLSLWRQKNTVEKLGVNFKGIRILDVWENEEGKVDQLQNRLVLTNPNIPSQYIQTTMQEVKKALYSEKAKGEENLLYLTQGHDFISLLQLLHKKFCTSGTQGEAAIRLIMNASYTAKAFSKTKLFYEIKQKSFSNNISYFRD